MVVVLLALGFSRANTLTSLAEHAAYVGEIVYARNTPYQRVVVTRDARDFQLFLSGALQFNSADEYRYHEALVHPAFDVAADPRRVLVLGGGDGLAVREVLKHDAVEAVTLVELDPEVTRLARELPSLVELNGASLLDPRVELVHDDAMSWLKTEGGLFDVIVVDFPDPHSFSIGKLYTRTFYERLLAHLSPDGAVAVQSTSPRLAPRSYWCIKRTLESAGFSVRPYRCGVPSFGEWGFMLAAPRDFGVPTDVPEGLAFLTDDFLPSLFLLPADAREPEDLEPNLLSTQVLVRTYEREVAP